MALSLCSCNVSSRWQQCKNFGSWHELTFCVLVCWLSIGIIWRYLSLFASAFGAAFVMTLIASEVSAFGKIVALLSGPICMIFILKSGIKTHLFDANVILYLYILMVLYLLLMQSSINVNIMEVFFQNKFFWRIIWQTKYYFDTLLITQIIISIIILIWVLIDVINGYSIIFIVKFNLIPINPSAETIIDNSLFNIPRGYAIAGCIIVKFVRDIMYCTSSATSFIRRCDDKEEGGDGELKVGDDIDVISVFALVVAEFNDSSINVNIMQVFFQNIFLSLIIWEINCYCDQFLIIQVITTIIILIWTLIDVINEYLLLCSIKSYLSTINSSASSIRDNKLPNIPRGYAIACFPSDTTPNFIRCADDNEKGGDGHILHYLQLNLI